MLFSLRTNEGKQSQTPSISDNSPVLHTVLTHWLWEVSPRVVSHNPSAADSDTGSLSASGDPQEVLSKPGLFLCSVERHDCPLALLALVGNSSWPWWEIPRVAGCLLEA